MAAKYWDQLEMSMDGGISGDGFGNIGAGQYKMNNKKSVLKWKVFVVKLVLRQFL